jgi:hypothetical protein
MLNINILKPIVAKSQKSHHVHKRIIPLMLTQTYKKIQYEAVIVSTILLYHVLYHSINK